MDDGLVVGRDVLKAVGGQTRVSILKALRQRQKTQSELASELRLSAPTVLEHMAQLEKANLIEPVPEYPGRTFPLLAGSGLEAGAPSLPVAAPRQCTRCPLSTVPRACLSGCSQCYSS